jgi:hypothetical protein
MALKKNTKTIQGFDAVDAYHRVETLRIEGKTKLFFQLNSYKDKAEKVSFDTRGFNCAYDLNGLNPIAQAYTYLKTLPEFAESVDC